MKTKKVLIIEDDQDAVLLFKSHLKEHVGELHIASTVEEAHDKVSLHSPEIIIVGRDASFYEMPAVNNFVRGLNISALFLYCTTNVYRNQQHLRGAHQLGFSRTIELSAVGYSVLPQELHSLMSAN